MLWRFAWCVCCLPLCICVATLYRNTDAVRWSVCACGTHRKGCMWTASFPNPNNPKFKSIADCIDCKCRAGPVYACCCALYPQIWCWPCCRPCAVLAIVYTMCWPCADHVLTMYPQMWCKMLDTEGVKEAASFSYQESKEVLCGSGSESGSSPAIAVLCGSGSSYYPAGASTCL